MSEIYEMSTLIYSVDTADESAKNDGSVIDRITLTLTGDTFYGDLIGKDLNNATDTVGCMISGVPLGLNAKLIITSANTAELSFSGQAIEHESYNNPYIQVSFFPTSFTSNIAPQNSDSSAIISFKNKSAFVSEGSFVENVVNDGSVTGTTTLTLYNDTFNVAAGTNLSGLVRSVPAGLSASLIVTDETHATLNFMGTAVNHRAADSSEVIIGFGDSNFTSGKAPVDQSVAYVEFIEPLLTWSTTKINDGEADGFDNVVILTLSDATFVRAGLDLTRFVSNVPAGVSVSFIVIDEANAQLTISGVANSPVAKNLSINLPKDVFMNRADVSGARSEISLTFDDTVLPTLTLDTVSDDNVVTDQEKAAGITVSGTSEANSTITLTFSAEGSDVIPAGDEITGEYLIDAWDDEVLWDEDTPVDEEVVDGGYYEIVSATEANAVISTVKIKADANGFWSYKLKEADVAFSNSELISAVATDAAGNESSTIAIKIDFLDTTAPKLPIIDVVAGDNLIDAAEKAAGVVVTGKIEIGTTAYISVNSGEQRAVEADENGNWVSSIYDYEIQNDTLVITATAIDAAGNISDVATEEVVADFLNHSPTGTITIKGEAKTGKTLTIANTLKDTDGMGDVTYQWLSDDGQFLGEGTSLRLTKDVTDRTISVIASYTDDLGTFESIQSAATIAVTTVNHKPSGGVFIQGEPKVGNVLSVKNQLKDADGLGEMSYQWFADEVAVSTEGVFTPTDSEVGKTIRVVTSYTDNADNFESISSPLSQPIIRENHLPTGDLIIQGEAKVGKILSILNTLEDEDGLGIFSYQWFADDTVISGTNQDSYKLTKTDLHKKLFVTVSYTDGADNYEEDISAETSAVKASATVTGVTKIGDSKNNKIQGATKNDDLSGLAGNDTLIGNAGNDVLDGGMGKDSLTGGAGADVFKFNDQKETGSIANTRDTITDFNHKEGDKIDLSTIDANADIAKNQAFTKPTIGAEFSGEFTKAGQLFFETSTHILYGNVNKDGAADFAIQLNGVSSLVASDFVL